MANQTRAWPSWKTRIGRDHAQQGTDEDEQTNPYQSRAAGQQESRLSALTHRRGVSHHRLPGTMPLSTMATAP